MKIGFVSLGCPKNQLDTEVMLHEVLQAGYEITPEDIDADVIIVNTCAFIESAKKEAIDNILDVAWLKKNRHLKAIIVTGCLAERYGEEIFKELPEVDAVLGVGSIHNIVEAIEAVTVKKKKGSSQKYFSHEDKNTVRLGGDRVLTTPEYTAYLKIAEGCDNRCAYCAIPAIRGKFRSRPMEDLVKEAKQLESLGVRELVVVAQDVTRYGLDLYGKYALSELLHKITEETSIPWIRLLYCYPDKVTDDLIAEMRDNPRILPYIDLPLQHISDHMLTAMNRHYTRESYLSLIRYMREKMPDIAISTDIIVGFPGETEEDFEDTLSIVKEARYDMMYSFIYSKRSGTPAAEMENQVPEEVTGKRFPRLLALQNEISLERNLVWENKVLRVLVDGKSKNNPDKYSGRTDGNKIVLFDADESFVGKFVNIKITRAQTFALIGEIVS
jgi:ribosomal protein S12 methylthiotransferase